MLMDQAVATHTPLFDGNFPRQTITRLGQLTVLLWVQNFSVAGHPSRCQPGKSVNGPCPLPPSTDSGGNGYCQLSDISSKYQERSRTQNLMNQQ